MSVMKCAFISDLHIKNSNDDAVKVFMAFCSHSKTLDADRVIFLGDIFDFMVGAHTVYTNKYSFFFERILKLIDSGKEVVFVEGNHDFNFKKVALNYFKEHTANAHNFRYLTGGEDIVLNNETYFYCHGYEVDYYNEHFKRWYRVYTSWWFGVFTTYILPFFVIQKLGDLASSDSKKRGMKSFNYDEMKKKYLVGAQSLIKEKKIKGIIAGHTHVPEFKTFEDGTQYLNPGFPSRDKFFLFFNGIKFEKIDLA